MHNFRGSSWTFAITYAWISIFLAGLFGYMTMHNLSASAQYAFSATVLGLLEVSMSFDNAVVNANILKTMPEVWQRRFITLGLPIAVFAMRGVFPDLVISAALHTDPVSALHIALTDPVRYHTALEAVKPELMTFGAAFLMPLALGFFFDNEPDDTWIGPLERLLAKTKIAPISDYVAYLYTLLVVALVAVFSYEPVHLLIAGAIGVGANFGIEKLGDILEDNEVVAVGKSAVRSGISGILYLELIDASMSFDGVIGAFAISTNPYVIMLGLGIGAMAVRTITLKLVATNSLTKYRYLGHGAFWAILILSATMMATTRFHVPESFTGIVGGVLVLSALVCSIIYNRRNPQAATETLAA